MKKNFLYFTLILFSSTFSVPFFDFKDKPFKINKGIKIYFGYLLTSALILPLGKALYSHAVKKLQTQQKQPSEQEPLTPLLTRIKKTYLEEYGKKKVSISSFSEREETTQIQKNKVRRGTFLTNLLSRLIMYHIWLIVFPVQYLRLKYGKK